MNVKKQKTWDKKWRLVIFDIPEKSKNARHMLTRKLRDLKFIQLQKSAWVCPYPCQNEVELLARAYEVDEHVRVATVSHLSRDKDLRKEFHL